jgi:hypothetical protein
MNFHGRVQRSLVAAGAGLLIASQAQAAIYAVVPSGPDAVAVIDPTAVERVDGQPFVRRAWNVTVKRSLVAEGPPQPGYVRMQSDYDCAQQRVRWRTFSVYSRFGALVMKKDNDDEAWVPAPDGSEEGASLRVVCHDDPGRSAVAANSISQVVIGLMQAWDAEAPLPPLQTPQATPKSKKPAHRDKAARRR